MSFPCVMHSCADMHAPSTEIQKNRNSNTTTQQSNQVFIIYLQCTDSQDASTFVFQTQRKQRLSERSVMRQKELLLARAEHHSQHGKCDFSVFSLARPRRHSIKQLRAGLKPL
jgi:hypothetical protein